MRDYKKRRSAKAKQYSYIDIDDAIDKAREIGTAFKLSSQFVNTFHPCFVTDVMKNMTYITKNKVPGDNTLYIYMVFKINNDFTDVEQLEHFFSFDEALKYALEQ